MNGELDLVDVVGALLGIGFAAVVLLTIAVTVSRSIRDAQLCSAAETIRGAYQHHNAFGIMPTEPSYEERELLRAALQRIDDARDREVELAFELLQPDEERWVRSMPSDDTPQMGFSS